MSINEKLFRKSNRNATKKFNRLLSNKTKWNLEQEKMKKLQDEFLSQKKGDYNEQI